MRALFFTRRCMKEILRDPINICFGLGFPLALLVLLSAIQTSVPVSLFEIETLTPGITVFGMSFITLFSATLVAKDRESAFLQRLYTTPMRSADFIVGYVLMILPFALCQTLVCYLFAALIGLDLSINVVWAILGMLPIALFYVSLGLLCGSALGVKQVGGVCGALLTNLSAWLSGVWFDISLVGGFFERIAKLLPFWHAVEMERALFNGNFSTALTHALPIILYTAVTMSASLLCFLRQMKNT